MADEPTAPVDVDRAKAGDGPMEVSIRPAHGDDLEAIRALLDAARLPMVGVADHLSGFIVAEEEGRLVGLAGLEVHGGDGLLRSVVVDPSLRGRGLGARLTERILKSARAARLGRLYLLTTTAEDYFPRYGFRKIPREEASSDVKRSVEFREACPASATVMALDLARPAAVEGARDGSSQASQDGDAQ